MDGKIRPDDNFGEIFDQEAQDLTHLDYKKLPQAGRFATCLSFGPYLVLWQCAKLCGLWQALEGAMPQNAQSILALAIQAVMAGPNRIEDFLIFTFDNYCGFDIPATNDEIERLLQSIGENAVQVKTFLQLYGPHFQKNFHSSLDDEDIFIFTYQDKQDDILFKEFHDIDVKVLTASYMISRGKIFIKFIAKVLKQTFSLYTRPLLKQNKRETIRTLLDELCKYKIKMNKDGTWKLVYALSDKQKEIFQLCYLTELDIVSLVTSLKLKQDNPIPKYDDC